MKLDDATDGEDQKADQGTDDDGVGIELQPQGGEDGYHGHPQVLGGKDHGFRLDGHDGFERIIPGFAVAEEGHDQAQHHAGDRNGHRQRQLRARDLNSTADQVLRQDIVQEDAAEADRQDHIGSGQAEGDDTGDQAAIQPHLRHDMQQGRDQDRDEGDMHRDQVLRGDADGQQGAQQQALDPQNVAGTRLFAELGDDLMGQQIGDAGAGDGDGKGAEHGIGEGDGRPSAQTIGEGLEGIHQ